MNPPNEIVKDLSVSMIRANLYSLFFTLPAVTVFLGGYLFLWGKGGIISARQVMFHHLWISLLVLVGGIVLHELFHALTWMYLTKKPIKTITFGINLKALSPYAHSNQAMSIRAYRWGAAVPGLLLGIIPSLAGWISGNGGIMAFGLLFTAAAGGDAMVLWMIRKENPETLVLDHAVNAGCLILRPTEGNNGKHPDNPT